MISMDYQPPFVPKVSVDTEDAFPLSPQTEEVILASNLSLSLALIKRTSISVLLLTQSLL